LTHFGAFFHGKTTFHAFLIAEKKGMHPASSCSDSKGTAVDQNRIKIIALIISIFFIVLAELNQRASEDWFSEPQNPFSLREVKK
jgi:hypothetical protein